VGAIARSANKAYRRWGTGGGMDTVGGISTFGKRIGCSANLKGYTYLTEQLGKHARWVENRIKGRIPWGVGGQATNRTYEKKRSFPH